MDAVRLADLSHRIDRVTLALIDEDPDDGRIERYVQAMADGHREAVACALSYALRRRELEGSSPPVDRAVALLAAVVRRMTRETRA
jgi:hypothetical protein